MGGPGGWGKVVLPLITVCNSGLVVGSTTLLEVHMARPPPTQLAMAHGPPPTPCANPNIQGEPEPA